MKNDCLMQTIDGKTEKFSFGFCTDSPHDNTVCQRGIGALGQLISYLA